jgi:hypothetical protein
VRGEHRAVVQNRTVEHLEARAARILEADHLFDPPLVGFLHRQCLHNRSDRFDRFLHARQGPVIADLPAHGEHPVDLAGVSTIRAARSSMRKYIASGSGPEPSAKPIRSKAKKRRASGTATSTFDIAERADAGH